MEESSKIQRSEVWEKIYKIVKQIPTKEVDSDCMDAPSAATEIEELFLKLLPIQRVSQQSEQLAISALDKIAHPIKYLQSEAEKEGAKIDGYMAIQITQDANFYQEIADKALKAIANCG
jgi:hypothetical protein